MFVLVNIYIIMKLLFNPSGDFFGNLYINSRNRFVRSWDLNDARFAKIFS